MSEIVERVAKVISDSRQVRAYGRVLTVWRAPEMAASFVDERLADARAAIEAMRQTDRKFVWNAINEIEPTLDVIIGHDLTGDEAVQVFNAVIDAALR